MTLVVDAFMAAAWLLPDERILTTDAILWNLHGSTASVPSLFWRKIRNLILVAERRNRLTGGEVQSCLAQLRRLPLVDAGHGNDDAVVTLATAQTLTAYDAVHLDFCAIMLFCDPRRKNPRDAILILPMTGYAMPAV